MKLFALTLAALFVSGTAMAQDKMDVAKAKLAQEMSSTNWRDRSRNAFAYDFEKRMLKAGINVTEIASMSYAKEPLTLSVLGPWTRADVYALMTKTDLLSGAYEAGWKRVRIVSEIGQMNVYFDLSHGVPTCDEIKRYCN